MDTGINCLRAFWLALLISFAGTSPASLAAENTTVITFDDASTANSNTSSVIAYFASKGITAESPALYLYVTALAPRFLTNTSSPPNALVVGNAIDLTLRFASPIRQFSFVRPALSPNYLGNTGSVVTSYLGSQAVDTITVGANSAQAATFTVRGYMDRVTIRCATYPQPCDQVIDDITLNGAPPESRLGAIFSSAQAGSQSFLRFYNSSTTASTATVTLRDATSGSSFGQWISPAIPAGAELQFPITTIENAIGVAIKPNYYAATVQSGTATSMQHVLWRSTDGTLTNLSTCAAGISTGSSQVAGVHSSLLAEYPSSVAVNNSGLSSAFVLGVYDARNGNRLGTYNTGPIASGGSLVTTMAAIETAAGITPQSGMFHYVVKVEGAFTGFLQHLVNNTRSGVTTDMTTVCALDATRLPEPAPQPLRLGAVYSTVQSGSQSFLRFYNTGTAAGTANVTLYNYANGAAIGTWTTPVIQPGTSPQYALQTIEAGLGSFTKPAYYRIAVQSGTSGFIQHVLWRSTDGTLTNLSTCETGVTANATQLNNVHSALLANGYPSSVVLNNTGSAASYVELGIYNAATATKVGTYTTPQIPASGNLVLSVADIESAAALQPATSSIYHYIIKVESAFTGFLQHLVNNQSSGVITDMTTICSLPVAQTYGLTQHKSGGVGTIVSSFGSAVTNGNSGGTTRLVEGTVVRLTAVPADGSLFSQWTGSCLGTSPTCQLTMTADRTVTGNFIIDPNRFFDLDIAYGGTGSGTVARSSPGPGYNYATTVTLTATPAANSTFAGWSGACTGTSTTCTVFIDAAKSVTANFTAATLSGNFTGSWSWSGLLANGCTANDGGAISLTMAQSGNNLTVSNMTAAGVQTLQVVTVLGVDLCVVSATNTYSQGTGSGTINGNNVTLNLNIGGTTFTVAGTRTGNSVSGTVRRSGSGTGSISITKP